MKATAGPFSRADAAPTQPQGRSGKHCVASTRSKIRNYAIFYKKTVRTILVVPYRQSTSLMWLHALLECA